jgi:hypothetical protein
MSERQWATEERKVDGRRKSDRVLELLVTVHHCRGLGYFPKLDTRPSLSCHPPDTSEWLNRRGFAFRFRRQCDLSAPPSIQIQFKSNVSAPFSRYHLFVPGTNRFIRPVAMRLMIQRSSMSCSHLSCTMRKSHRNVMLTRGTTF